MNAIFVKSVNSRCFGTINDSFMAAFSKKLKECREAQSEVSMLLNTNHPVIGEYERDEIKPTVDVVKKLAETLDTTVGYLLGETQDQSIFKDQDMLKRLNKTAAFSSQEREHILFALDAMISRVKLKSI